LSNFEKAFPIYEQIDPDKPVPIPVKLKVEFRNLWRFIEESVPPGRCRSLALTHLETAGMFAVKQIHQGGDS
jgi:hypothetical protein